MYYVPKTGKGQKSPLQAREMPSAAGAAAFAAGAAATRRRIHAPTDSFKKAPCFKQRQGCCQVLCFFFFGLVVVPIVVFALSAFLTIPMWGFECFDAHDHVVQTSHDANTTAAGRRLTTASRTTSSVRSARLALSRP